MSQGQSRRLLDVSKIVDIAQDTLTFAVSTVLWGRETILPQINMDVISKWFQAQMRSRPGGKYGVLYAKIDVSSDSPRLYQGLFDSDWKCIAARQIVSDQIDKEIIKLLEDHDLVVFDPSLRLIRKTRAEGREK